MNTSELSSAMNPSALKMLIFVRRLASFSHTGFSDYWQHQHAPLALSAYERGHAPPMLGYVQNHTIASPLASSGETKFDGLTEVWLEKLDDLDMGAQASDELIATNQMLIEDEASFWFSRLGGNSKQLLSSCQQASLNW